MNLESQEKAANIIREQATKLGEALSALRKIARLNNKEKVETAKQLAGNALRGISDYGKDPEDL